MKRNKRISEETGRVYGWIPDIPDHRDFRYAVKRATMDNLPPSANLRGSLMPEVYDQENIGSCTSNAIGGAYEFNQMKQGFQAFIPSRLFVYYNEREMEGTTNEDAGAMIRDGMKSVAAQGVCPETEWVYHKTNLFVKPPESCYQHATEHQVLAYQRVDQTIDQMRGCLAEGYPFVMGISIYSSFESSDVKRTGVVPMPGRPNSSAIPTRPFE